MLATEEKLDISASDDASTIDTRGGFHEWLVSGHAKKINPNACVSCMDVASDYALKRKISQVTIWGIDNRWVYVDYYKKLCNDKIFRVTDKRNYQLFVKAGVLYAQFLKEYNRSLEKAVANSVVEIESDVRNANFVWDENVSISFQNWMIANEKAPATARSYSSAVRNVVSKFKTKYEMAQSEGNLSDCAKSFVESLANDTEYIVWNEKWHNQCSAALKAFVQFASDWAQDEYNASSTNQSENAEIICPPSASGFEDKIPDSLTYVLATDFAGGFRFDATAVRLLSGKSGIELDERIQCALKKQMFCRGDEVYFLLDTIVNKDIRQEIIQSADSFLNEYGCFEVCKLYSIYEDKLNSKYISGVDDFEKLYECITDRDVRIVATPNIGNRIARLSGGNVWDILAAIAKKIVEVTNDKFGGVINEDDLQARFCAFSLDLLSKIIRFRAEDELLRTEINGIVCYQTFEALGLPTEFPEVLSETLERLEELGLAPNEEILHTALSLALGVNLKAEYNLPDQATYRRLIAAYCNTEPRREWKYGVFGEVVN